MHIHDDVEDEEDGEVDDGYTDGDDSNDGNDDDDARHCQVLIWLRVKSIQTFKDTCIAAAAGQETLYVFWILNTLRWIPW